MKARALIFCLLLSVCAQTPSALGMEWADLPALVKRIPPRLYSAMSGSEFAKYVSTMDESLRERAVLGQLLRGNLPEFLKNLKPVRLAETFEDGKAAMATIFVMPDYLAIGSDRDFLRVPMALSAAVDIAGRFGFILPTRKMVDAIFEQSALHLTPQPMPAGPEMRSTAYVSTHNRRIKEQRQALGGPPDALVSGHKKDLVLTNRLARRPGRVAIYGWHRPSGVPIQPLSTVHRADYADYSHGVRLVSETVLLDGKPCSIYDVLQDPRLARILTDEGVLQAVRPSRLFELQRAAP